MTKINARAVANIARAVTDMLVDPISTHPIRNNTIIHDLDSDCFNSMANPIAGSSLPATSKK